MGSTGKILYILIHIPKCGGITIRKTIESQFGYEPTGSEKRLALYSGFFNTVENTEKYLEALDQGNRDALKIIYGHNTYYGIHRHFPGRDVRYVTYLRDPVKRTISDYNYFRYKLSIGRDAVLGSQKETVSLSRWLDTCSQTENFMLWFLTGRLFPDKKLSLTDFKPSEEDLEKVKARLRDFYFVGLVENSDEDFNFFK